MNTAKQNPTDTMKAIENLPHGAYARFRTRRVLKTAMKMASLGTLEKVSEYTARPYIDYENLASTQEKRANGEEAQGLNGMEWLKFPLFLKSVKTGKIYVRLYRAENSNAKSTYFLNGVEKTKQELRDMGFPESTFGSKQANPSPCFNVEVGTIVAINQ